MAKLTRRILGVVLVSALAIFSTSCKTKDDVMREQQLKRLSNEMKQARASQANTEQTKQELQMEITRLASLIDAQAQRIDQLEQKIQKLEDRPVAPPPPSQPAAEAPKAEPSTFAEGKALFDKGEYVRAMAALKRFLASAPEEDPAREKAHFMLAESYFANKDFTLAALEYNKFKRSFPKSANIPTAIYRQAVAFKNMGKKTEAKLFYQELIDRFPKHPLTAKAKKEIKGV